MTGLSIVVCTYNPESIIFDRVIDALAAIPSNDTECIVIDNNSVVPIASRFSNRLKQLPAVKIFVEPNQGLTAARIRGIRESNYSHILFIDDDNEVIGDFIGTVLRIVNDNSIGAFNPGTIHVEYIGEVSPWFRESGKVHFQESEIKETALSTDTGSFRHWPFGTGLCVRREAAELYLKKVESGEFSLTDRKGGVMTSGGDGQLVACAVAQGYAVGRVKELRLNHLIHAGKATISYISRQDYGIYYSGEIFIKECYPEKFRKITLAQEVKYLVRFFTLVALRMAVRGDYNKFRIALAALLGTIAGNRAASGGELPWLYRQWRSKYLKKK